MDGNMRRLPPWMLAGASSSVTASSNQTNNKSVEVKRDHGPEVPKTKAQKRPRRSVKPKETDDSEEPRKVGIRRRGKKIEEAKHSIDEGNNPESIQSGTGPEDEDLTVDDLLSFAQEYVKGEEQDRTRNDGGSLSVSESMVVVDNSNIGSSQGGTKEPNGIRDSTAADMLDLLLGPFFKSSQQ